MWAVAISVITTLMAILATILYGIHGRASQIFGRSLHRGSQQGRRIALTFDDGPSEQTPELLEYLKQEGVTATFFLVGANVRRLPHIARAVAEAGHEIGNHTDTHLRLCPRIGYKLNLQSPAAILRELTQAQQSIETATGVQSRLFRAPYGMRWFGLRGTQRRLGLTGVMWTVIGHDWEWNAGRIAEHVLANAAPGGVICLHDSRDIQPDADIREMLTALRQIVPQLKRRGYSFETVSHLCLSSGS